ncbi:MAG: hypothetical protein V4582_02270 [Pseudomonadota bacterium]
MSYLVIDVASANAATVCLSCQAIRCLAAEEPSADPQIPILESAIWRVGTRTHAHGGGGTGFNDIYAPIRTVDSDWRKKS